MNVSHDTIVSNKHEEQTRHDYVCQFPTMLSATLPHASAEVSFPGFSQEREVQHPVSSSWDNMYVLEVQQKKPKEKTPEELVPKEYHKFLKVFLKKESECMLLWKPWNHTIDLKETFKPKKGHIIPLSPAEQEEVMAFLDDQLKKGYI